MTPSNIPDDWVRLQIYLPEYLRYELRQEYRNLRGDSYNVRKILYSLLSPSGISLLREILLE